MVRLVMPVVALVLGAAPAAHATLVYTKSPAAEPSVRVAADDGTGSRRLASGSYPRISPDGATVVFLQSTASSSRPDLMAVPADGSAPARVLARGWRDPFTFAWSPDSRSLVTVAGPELGARRLTLIDIATGAQRTVARGYFAGVSFSPAGDELLYGRSPSERYPPRADVFRAPVSGAAPPVAVTSDHRSEGPLWGPSGRVVFVKLVDAARRRYAPKNELYLMAPDGTGVRRLTHTTLDELLQGLWPTAWSADGTRLLAELSGQDTSYAETVDPATGRHRPVVKAQERGFVGTDLSADGTTILGSTGGADPSAPHTVATIPYGGGAPRVLARDATDPDWNR